MPPKRKAAAAKKAAGGKKAKKAEPEPDAPPTAKDCISALKKADAGKKKSLKADSNCPLANSAQVVDDFDCMLNQTNIGHNNNKYYIIQVLMNYGSHYTWNRWGRVGEVGQSALKGPINKDDAVKEFKKKFKDKTKNDWDKRSSFAPVPGKYTLIEIDADEGDEEYAETATKLAALDDEVEVKKVTAACTLDAETKKLVEFIFDEDMFKSSMAQMEIDVKKMPLGKLSKSQITKGFEVLEELEECIKNSTKKRYDELTSRFYTLIPHNFGRQRPPIISDAETIRKKMDMLMVLADIELAQSMQKDKEKPKKSTVETKTVAHPLDQKMGLLQCGLDTVKSSEKDFKVIEKYLSATGPGSLKLMTVWRVDRNNEDARFGVHDSLTNRKLLWHGTNTAVVAAILKSGLRIMPHSGGRVGRGIYFASENAKSAGYVGTATMKNNNNARVGIMFLNEVVLGKEHHITRDDSSLVKAPTGTDCVIAKGRTEPDPKHDTSISIDGKKIVVPQGKPINTTHKGSSFWQSEYLIYKESQNRIRFLCLIKW